MNKPLITVISTNHLIENQDYLTWSLKSIQASVGVDIEILCYSSAKECPEVPDGVFLRHDPVNNVSCSAKFNHGVKAASPHSKYICMIADDVMVSKYALAELAGAICDRAMILGPASNCDGTTRYQTQFQLFKYLPYTGTAIPGLMHPLPKAITIGVKSTLEEIKGFEQSVIDYPLNHRFLIDPGWISYYCVMMPKSVIQAVGGLDENMDIRWNDYVHCERARKLGIPAMIDLGAFALHFGDKTIPKCATQADYDLADKAFAERHLPNPEDHMGDLL